MKKTILVVMLLSACGFDPSGELVGTLVADASVPPDMADAALPGPTDAGQVSSPDGAPGLPDASAPVTDAGAPAPDAAMPPNTDAGTPDAATPAPDAATDCDPDVDEQVNEDLGKPCDGHGHENP